MATAVATSATEIYLPPLVVFGRGALEQVGMRTRSYGTRALIVTDRGLVASGLVDRVTGGLNATGVESIVFAGVEPNPTVPQVEAGLNAGAGREVDVVVSVGGGSAHDCAKMVALVAANGGQVRDYEGSDRARGPGLPLVAVNTTAGTGADVSRFAVITDTERKVKMVIADRRVMPAVAINDPLTTVGMPKAVTMASGLDALTHSIEAYVSTLASDLSDVMALRGVELATKHLVRAVDAGYDIDAREGMMLGSLYAGLAINSALVGATHALAHALGALLDLPHGVCNGILLPHVCAANYAARKPRYDRLAAIIGGSTDGKRLPQLLRRIGDRVGLPRGLAALGVNKSHISALTERALADMTMSTNPRQLSGAEVSAVYERAL
ncbi:MAG TPA: iron-containing alcohol dehydrogenase [Candidatus Dormibacteraeota bacterium]